MRNTLVAGLLLGLVVTATPAAADQQRPTYPLPTCQTITQAQCQAILTNRWDGRQVVHQLDPVPTCPSARTVTVLAERVTRKNATIAHLRAKVARLRERAARYAR